MSVKDGPLGFTIVPHKYVVLSHQREVGPIPSNFGFSSIPIPFLRADDDLVCPRKVVDILEIDIVNFSCVVSQVQDDDAYPLGFYDTPDVVNFCIVPRIGRFILYIEFEGGINGVSATRIL